MKRKLFAVLISVILSFVLIPQTASATYSGECGKNLTWELVDGNTLVISGTGEMYDYIYTTYESDPAKQAPWRKYADAIIRIELEEGVTNIPGGAFCNLYNLKSISLPDSLKVIEGGAFWDCNRLETIYIPEGTKQIGNPPIDNSPIGYMPFGGCDNLDGIWVDEDNPNYCNDEFGVLFNKEKTKLLAIPGQLSGEYQIPHGVRVAQFYIPETLDKILISASVEFIDLVGLSISWEGFKGYVVDENNSNYSCDEHGVLFNKEKSQLIYTPVKMPAYYVVPDTVTVIDHFAIHGMDIMGIQLPVSLKYLDISCNINTSTIKDIYYEGTEEQWNNIKYAINFTTLHDTIDEDVTIHYNSVIPEELLHEPEETTEPTQISAPTEVLETAAEIEIPEETVTAEAKPEQQLPRSAVVLMVWLLGTVCLLVFLGKYKNQFSNQVMILVCTTGVVILVLLSVLLLAKDNSKEEVIESVADQLQTEVTEIQTEVTEIQTEETENTEPPEWIDNMLMSTTWEDLATSGSGVRASMLIPVFGSEMKRGEIKTVTFLDTLQDMPQDSWDVSEYQNGSVMAWVEPNGALYDLYIAGEGGVNGAVACFCLFYYYHNLEQVNFSDAFHTDNTKNMSHMFGLCKNLSELDVSVLKTDNVEDFSGMFYDCEKLKSLHIRGLVTEKAQFMGSMFNGCKSLLEIEVGEFDISNVTSIGCMFCNCESLTVLDVSEWSTSNVKWMSEVFAGCKNLKKLDVSNWDVSKVTDMSGMFYGCNSLKELDVSNWDTSKVENFGKFYSYEYLPDGTPWLKLFLSN